MVIFINKIDNNNVFHPILVTIADNSEPVMVNQKIFLSGVNVQIL
jgi:hypothetical protein